MQKGITIKIKVFIGGRFNETDPVVKEFHLRVNYLSFQASNYSPFKIIEEYLSYLYNFFEAEKLVLFFKASFYTYLIAYLFSLVIVGQGTFWPLEILPRREIQGRGSVRLWKKYYLSFKIKC